jgi:signal transduction histidine kinase
MARHRRVVDVTIAVCYLLIGVPTTLFGGTGGPWAKAASVALTVVAAAALVVRRRWPVVSFGVILATSALGWPLNQLADPIAVPIALYALAVYRSVRSSWIGMGVVVAVSVLCTLLFSTGPDRWASTSFVLVFTLAIAAIGMAVGSRRRYVDALIDRAQQLAREREQREALAAAAERTRIAREMHDIVAHSLSVMISLADGAGVVLRRDPANAAELLDQVAETGRSALSDMRRVLGLLRDPIAPLAPQPTSADLGSIIETFRRSGLPVRFTTSGAALPADAGLQLAVYRIVQESLTNVLRYAPGAGSVDVVVAHEDDQIDIRIDNSGDHRGGLLAIPGTGQGIVGMQERAAVYQGTVTAGPYGGGWRVQATMRWTEARV